MGTTMSAPAPPPPKVVLVPPAFQRDIRGLSRFCRSSYDYLGDRKQLARLLSDHLTPELRGVLLLSPPDDPRVTVRAKLRQSGGSMVLRWQPASAASRHTFLEMAASLDAPGEVSLRGSYLHSATGLGAFMMAPLGGNAAQVGVRYSSTHATAGAIFLLRLGELDKLWLAGRLPSGWTLGAQLSGRVPIRQIPTLAGSRSDEVRSWFRSHASVMMAYSPPPRPGAASAPFTAAVELARGRQLTFSFFQHLAATRQIVNPLEDDEVVGITNYLDIGLQLTTTITGKGAPSPGAGDTHSTHTLIRPATDTRRGGSSAAAAAATVAAAATQLPEPSSGSAAQPNPDPPPSRVEAETAHVPSIDLAASWQINKNWLLKARVGTHSAAAAVGARVWHAVSAYLTASVSVDYARPTIPRYGVELCVENFGPLQYERGADDVPAGRALLQRHEASPQDLANAAGKGPLVRRTPVTNRGRGGNEASAQKQQQQQREEERRRVAQLM